MEHIYKQIVNLQFKCNDYIDDHYSSSAKSLKSEVQRLEDEAQVRKNATSLQHRVDSVIKYLEHCGDSGSMSHGHVNELVSKFEQIRHELGKLR